MLFNIVWDSFLRSIFHSTVEEYCGLFILGYICLLYMITFVLMKVDMYLWSHSCSAEINAPYVVCGNTWALFAYFGSDFSCRFPSCVYFNTVTFGSSTCRREIVLFSFMNGVFGV